MTESSSAFRGSTPSAGLQAEQRRHGLQIVLDAVVDLLSHHAAQRHTAVLQRHRRVVCDRLEQLPILGREGRVAIDDQLPDLTALPAQRQPDRVRAGAPLRPGDTAVLEHERRPAAWSDSTVVCTISASDSSRYSDSDTVSEIRASDSSSRTRRCASS